MLYNWGQLLRAGSYTILSIEKANWLRAASQEAGLDRRQGWHTMHLQNGEGKCNPATKLAGNYAGTQRRKVRPPGCKLQPDIPSVTGYLISAVYCVLDTYVPDIWHQCIMAGVCLG